MHNLLKFVFSVFMFAIFFPRLMQADPATLFIENKGQWHEHVLFKASIPGGELYVLKNRIKYVFYPKPQRGHHGGFFDEHHTRLRTASPHQNRLHQAVELSYPGSNPGSIVSGDVVHFSNLNYFFGETKVTGV
jgi:hypothetical protein